MINLLLGQPGGGKSYESVAYHILPAIVEQGRKVITNLSLNLPMWETYFPGSTKLIEIRGDYQLDGKLCRAFSRAEDYADTWKKEGSGQGPLYVIDECHKAIPRIGTPVSVAEWYAEHRHSGADVLLITQSYGKIDQAIRDVVQVVYRCKKATAFGSNDRYIRKVQDGLRGEVVNTTVRQYESKFFALYKSHTHSNGAILEAMAGDIVPIWKRWPFKGAAICFVVAACIFVVQLSKSAKDAPQQPETIVYDDIDTYQQQPPEQPPEQGNQPPEIKPPSHPYQGKTMHLKAMMKGLKDGIEYINGYIAIAVDGNPLNTISFSDLREAGYVIRYHSPGVVSLSFSGTDIGYVVEDLPRASLAASVPSPVAMK